MKYTDYAPPAIPSRDEQRDALQKGLGRAVQWALSGRLHSEPLVEVCLRDQRFDAQVEDSRGNWLWGMISATAAAEPFRGPILQALQALSEERSASQLCEIAKHYAQAGDQSFRRRLYEIVDQKPIPDSPWLGEQELVELEGEHGFLFAAAATGKCLAHREWHFVDGSLMDLGIQRFGEVGAQRILKSSQDEAVHRYWESWQRRGQRNVQSPAEGHRARMLAIPVSQVLRESQSGTECYWLHGWGRYAPEADLQIVLQHLFTTSDTKILRNLLRAFAARPLPAIDKRMFDLCEHPDAEIRRCALRALEPNSNPLVRDYAISRLRGGRCDGPVIALLKSNFQANDETAILNALELPDDACDRHWLVMDVIEILENNPAADCSALGVICYFETPCENCRFKAVKRLLDQNVAPAWLLEECRRDSNVECREQVTRSDEAASVE